MGSPNGLWTAVSGGMAQSQNVDIISNNLANAGTTGFKKDTPTFKEFLTAVERPGTAGVDIPQTVFKDSDFYHFDGREHAMVNMDKVHTDHRAGNLKPTRGPFDLGLEGPGFFTVQTPAGLMFTRAGDFKINGEGRLVTNDGHAVMALVGAAAALKNPDLIEQAQAQAQANPGAARTPAGVNPFAPPAPGAEPLIAPINLKTQISEGQKIQIGQNGLMYAGDTLVGVLAIAEFADPQLLEKTTSTMYSNPNTANVARMADQSTVHQGFLEGSNVNPVSELMELLKANRMYESNMRAIKAYNDMAGKEANEVGKL